MTEVPARERVISAAEELYYTKGFAAVGMDELRTAAGVSLKRLYQEFGSKDDIVLAVLDAKRAEWQTGLRAHVEASGDHARTRLLAVYDYLEQWFCVPGFRGCGFINAFGELGGTHPEVAGSVRAHKAQFQEDMRVLVREVGGDDALAAQLALLAEGAQSTAAISGDPEAARQARRAAEILIDASLGARG